VPIVLKPGGLSLLESSGPVQTCKGIALPLPVIFKWTQFLVVEFQTSEEYITFATTQREQTTRATTDLEDIVLDDVAANPGTNSRG
jgi:hypothetical protein